MGHVIAFVLAKLSSWANTGHVNTCTVTRRQFLGEIQVTLLCLCLLGEVLGKI